MNQAFKLRFDQMRESDPTTDLDTLLEIGGDSFYSTPGSGRNICFAWPNGNRFFLNYAYLITGELNLVDHKNMIKLDFSSHTVSLNGYSLEPLFIALLEHLPRMVNAIDPRYFLDDESNMAIVIEIIIKNKDD